MNTLNINFKIEMKGSVGAAGLKLIREQGLSIREVYAALKSNHFLLDYQVQKLSKRARRGGLTAPRLSWTSLKSGLYVADYESLELTIRPEAGGSWELEILDVSSQPSKRLSWISDFYTVKEAKGCAEKWLELRIQEAKKQLKTL